MYDAAVPAVSDIIMDAVRLGATDYQWTEVVAGLRKGDEVVVEVATAGTTTKQSLPGGVFPRGK